MNLNTYRELSKLDRQLAEAREQLRLIDDESVRNTLQMIIWSLESVVRVIKAAV